MEKLIEDEDDFKTSEKKVMRYVQKLSDDEIKNLYETIEFTPFNFILRKEYRRRFS